MTREQTSPIGVAVGTPVRFNPAVVTGGKGMDCLPPTVKGTVVYINWAHGWFLVEYGPGLRSGFKLGDLGGVVTVVGGRK